MISRVKKVGMGEAVRRARDERHLSQREAAEILGVAARTIQHWEAGGTPQPRHRRAILAWLKEAA